MIKFCDEIEDYEYYFCCTGYEDYSDGYWDSDWIYEYSDLQGIGRKLEEAFLLAESLVYEKCYSEVDELYDRLISLEIFAYYEDAEEMLDEGLSIVDAVNEKLINIDLMDVCSHILYTIFQAKTGNKCILSMYHVFHNEAFREVPLESMFSVGSEPINEIDEFMTAFYKFLMTKKGSLESRLLKETIPYIKEDGIKIAREAATIYPSIYYELCMEALMEKQFEKVIEIGEDALKYIPSKLIMRSKIAYITANAYRKKSDNIGYKKCFIEGFISNSSPVNFLSLFTVCNVSEIKEVFGKMKNSSIQMDRQHDFVTSELSVNNISYMNKSIIRFFSGEYNHIKRDCIVDKKYLGWSNSLKGLSIPLFLILLENGNKDFKAKNKIVENIKLRLGIYSELQFTPDFEEMILYWKTKMPLIDSKKEYIEWIQDEVDKRVEGVVGGGYRKSYHKGAELIVYLGQVLESNGEKGATMRLVDKYKKIYSRKRAFKSELNDLLS
ncbi:hypothetical protein [Wukongibacter sp. M2B1]|uniref:hypothetical protein n=1 Tax=Wukongibacter sp. M2B1 TaxID=3088895 RepID=UPI003D7904CC